MRFLFPRHFNTIRTNKQTNKHTDTQQSSFNNIDMLTHYRMMMCSLKFHIVKIDYLCLLTLYN